MSSTLFVVYFSCNQVSFLWPWLDNSRISLSRRLKKMTVLVISPFLMRWHSSAIVMTSQSMLSAGESRRKISTTASTMIAVSKLSSAKFAKRMKPTMPEKAQLSECRQLPAVALTFICRSLRPQFSPIYTHRYTDIPRSNWSVSSYHNADRIQIATITPATPLRMKCRTVAV